MPTLPPSLKTLCLFVHELRVITFPTDYHRKCVRGHCACAESCEPSVGGQKRLHFWNTLPDLPIHYTTFIGLRRRLRVVYSRVSPKLKPLIAYFFAGDRMTLTFDLLTLNSSCTWRVMLPTLPPSLKTLCLFVHELRVITFPIDYHRKCVRGHCACAESREPSVGGQKRLHFWNPLPDLPIRYTTFIGLRRRLRVVYSRAVQC